MKTNWMGSKQLWIWNMICDLSYNTISHFKKKLVFGKQKCYNNSRGDFMKIIERDYLNKLIGVIGTLDI